MQQTKFIWFGPDSYQPPQWQLGSKTSNYFFWEYLSYNAHAFRVIYKALPYYAMLPLYLETPSVIAIISKPIERQCLISQDIVYPEKVNRELKQLLDNFLANPDPTEYLKELVPWASQVDYLGVTSQEQVSKDLANLYKDYFQCSGPLY